MAVSRFATAPELPAICSKCEPSLGAQGRGLHFCPDPRSNNTRGAGLDHVDDRVDARVMPAFGLRLCLQP